MEKLYYRISEVTQILGVENASVIRHWEKEIKLLNPKKSGNRNRLFTQKDIDLLKKIQYYKAKGYRLEAINKKLLQEKTNGKIDKLQVIENLKEIRVFLESLISK